jgi:hypothetical protein
MRTMQRHLVVATLSIAGALAACGDDHKRGPDPQPDAGMPPPDGGSIVIPLEREQAGGWPGAVAVVGKRAYIGVGPRLTIWDLGTSPPAQLGETSTLRGVVDAVAVVGDRAYVAERQDLDSLIHVFDVTTPTAPVETHAFSVANSFGYSVIRDLAGATGRLYVADMEQGVVELDLADPDAPTVVRVAPPTGVVGLRVIGSRLYYTSGGFIGSAAGVLDRDNELEHAGSSPLGNLKGIGFSTNNLLVGAGPDGIYVFDVSDPWDPVEKFHHGAMEEGPFARAIATHGTIAWIPADDGLHTLDLTDPDAIVHHGPIAVETTNVNATAANGDVLAIVTDRGRLLSFGVATDPTRPTEPATGDVSLCADCVGVTSVGGIVYMTDIVGGLRTAALADLASHGRSAALPVIPNMGGLQFVFEDVAVAGNHAYVADWLYGLRIYDVTSSHLPTLVGSLETGGMPSAVAIDGDRAYIAEGTNGGMLRVIDVSDRAKPFQLAAIPTSKAMAVEIRGNIAYVADESLFGSGGLRTFDVSLGTSIVPLGLYDRDCQWASDVALVGNLAVVACASNDFHLVDISNPANPTRVAVIPTPNEIGAAISVAAWDGHAALGHDLGVTVVTVGASPQTVATFPTAWPVRALSIPMPGRIVAAAGPGGVYQFELAAN